MQNENNILFVGVKISGKLQEELDDTKVSMKPFFRENNPEYLQVLRIDSNEYIGKSIKNGASYENLGNVLLNIKSMLKMITPKYLLADNALKIYAHSPKPARIF